MPDQLRKVTSSNPVPLGLSRQQGECSSPAACSKEIPGPVAQFEPCSLSHDLNNYLGVIIGRAEALAVLVANDGAAWEHVIGIMRTANTMADAIRTRKFQPQPETYRVTNRDSSPRP
jgi:hypothetical protein